MESTEIGSLTPWYLSILAKAHADLGSLDDAGRCLDEAIAAAEATRENWCTTDIHRIAAETALMSPGQPSTQAEAHFEQALSVAREQSSKSFELRAALGLARLWREQSKHTQARDLLATTSGAFTEGFDTLDLKQARALLDTLAS